MSKTAGIIVIGNELLSGRTRDENAAYLLKELRDLGVLTRRVAIIPDEIAAVAGEVRNQAAEFDYVFTSGGVGPTHDDVTIAGIASAFGRAVYRSPELEATLRGYYQESMTDATLRIADIPAGASLLGSGGMRFPVIVMENVYIFPGVPELLASKFAAIREMFREPPFLLREVFLGVDEGLIADALNDVLRRFPELGLGSYPAFNHPDYLVKLTLESKNSVYLENAHRFLMERLGVDAIFPIEPGRAR